MNSRDKYVNGPGVLDTTTPVLEGCGKQSNKEQRKQKPASQAEVSKTVGQHGSCQGKEMKTLTAKASRISASSTHQQQKQMDSVTLKTSNLGWQGEVALLTSSGSSRPMAPISLAVLRWYSQPSQCQGGDIQHHLCTSSPGTSRQVTRPGDMRDSRAGARRAWLRSQPFSPTASLLPTEPGKSHTVRDGCDILGQTK